MFFPVISAEFIKQTPLLIAELLNFRVKKLTKMSEKVATGILSGVVKVSGFFTSSIVNSAVGKKFFSLLPGEIVLASLDGFSKHLILSLAQSPLRSFLSISPFNYS